MLRGWEDNRFLLLQGGSGGENRGRGREKASLNTKGNQATGGTIERKGGVSEGEELV